MRPIPSVLMTGQHMGHTHVRGNAGGDMTRQSLRGKDFTVAEALKKANYSTALIGKWGLGEVGQEGHPLDQGFDYLYGYLNQVHALKLPGIRLEKLRQANLAPTKFSLLEKKDTAVS